MGENNDHLFSRDAWPGGSILETFILERFCQEKHIKLTDKYACYFIKYL